MTTPTHLVTNSESESDASAARVARAPDNAGVPTRGAIARLVANSLEFLSVQRVSTGSGGRLKPLSGRST